MRPSDPPSAIRHPKSAISIIVAMAEGSRVIGRGGELPWHLSADLKRFKRLTMGHAILMGRLTWESIGRPLPGRTSIVLTGGSPTLPAGVLPARSLDEALRLCGDDSEPFVIGGERAYREALPRARRIYLTLVHAQVQGDAFFPELDERAWREVSSERFEADERNEHPHTFRVLERGS